MFEFANVIPLFGLCLISIIILIHLRGKKRKKVQFSTLSFFKARRTVVSRKSIHILILILQIAIATFIIMSIAKPRLSSDTDEIALVLDMSNTMGTKEENKTRIDLLKEEAIEIVEDTKARKINLVAFADGTWFVANSTNKSKIISEINSLDPVGGSSDIDYALKTTIDTLGEYITIYLLTDGTNSNIYSSLNYVNNKNSKVIAKLIGSKNGSTVAISDITIPENVQINNKFSVSTKILNYLDKDKEVTITLELNNQNISQRTVTVSSKKYKDVTFDNVTIYENKDHFLTAYLETDQDDIILSDNIRYRVIPEPEIIAKVLYIENFLDQKKYVESALKVNPYISVETYGSLDSNLASKLNDYNLVILSDLHKINIDPYTTQLINYVQNGSYLFIASGNNTDSYSKIDQLLPFEFENIINISNEGINSSSSVFQDVDLTQVKYRKIANVSIANENIEQIVNISYNGSLYPLFFSYELGSGNIYYYTSTTTFGANEYQNQWTDWPKKYSFPIFWGNLLELALKGAEPTLIQKDFLAGETLIFNQKEEYNILLPNNKTISGHDIFTNFYLPGFYQVNISNNSYYISVNGEINEYEAEPILNTVENANDFFGDEDKLSQRYNDLWWYFVLFGFIAMMIEWNVNWRV